jgi:hypothetical protein
VLPVTAGVPKKINENHGRSDPTSRRLWAPVAEMLAGGASATTLQLFVCRVKD